MQQVIDMILDFSRTVPIEVFVFFGAIIEELVAPIPSPFIMTTASLLLMERGAGLWKFVEIVLIASIGKTLASILVFFVADTFEDFFTGRYGKYFGLDHKRIENYGQIISGNKWSWILFGIFRSLPIVPFFPLSVVAGLVKMKMSIYLITTFLGSVLRYSFYVFIVYFGADKVFEDMDALNVVLVSVFIILAIFTFYKLKDRFHEHLMSMKK